MNKLVDLSFEIVDMEGNSTGQIAGPIVGAQMNDYIVRMEREGEQEILSVMQKAQEKANVGPYALDMPEDELYIVYNWLVKFSGFYGESLIQLSNAFLN